MPRAAKKPSKPAVRQEPEQLVNASILVAETVNTKYSINAYDQAMIARCAVQSMHTAIAVNVTACMGQPLRLYRKAGASGSKFWPGRKVTNRKRLAFLQGHHITVRPSAKNAGFFEQSPDIEEVMDSPLLTLLRQPDPTMTGPDWWALHWWFKEALGKDFVWKGEPDTWVNGAPTCLFHMFPQFTRIKASSDRKIDAYWYGRNMVSRITLPPEQVMYLMHRPSPLHPLEAESWPQAQTLLGDVANAAIQAEIARWNTGGQPGLVLTVDENTTDDQVRQIERRMAQMLRGVNKTGGLLVLKKSKLEQVGVKPNEMHYMEGMKYTEDQIYSAAGIPEAMRKMGSAALASAERADPQYTAYTVNPRLVKTADDLNTYLLPLFHDPNEYSLAFDNPVAEDRKALVDEAVKLQGAATIKRSEARAMLEIEPDPEDEETDVYRFNGVDVEAANRAGPQQTISLQGLATSVVSGTIPKDSAKAIARASMPQIPQEDLNAIFDGLEPKPQEAPKPGTGAPVPGNEGGGDKNPPTDPLQPSGGGDSEAGDGGKAKALPAVRPQLTTKDDRLVQQPKEVTRELDRLEAAVKPWYERAMAHGVNDHGGVNIDSFLPELNAIMAEHLPAIMAAAGRDAAGADFKPNLVAIEWARTQGSQLVTNVSESLKQTLASRVADGIEAGQSMTMIQNNIRAEAPEFSANRAENIARTETSMAANEGARLGYKSTGVLYKDFDTAGDPCPVCEAIKAAHPNPMPIEEPYMVDGEPLQAPPFHPQCRCTLLPVTDDQEDGE